MVTIECTVDHRVHPRIIGQKGRGIRKLMEQYKVDVRFPRAETDDDPNVILITGEEEDCMDCKDALLNIEEEYVSLSPFSSVGCQLGIRNVTTGK